MPWNGLFVAFQKLCFSKDYLVHFMTKKGGSNTRFANWRENSQKPPYAL